MRQLQAESWMHNRVRMVVASFLIKDLHIGWWHGADWFMTYLRDGDIAQNQLNWQWVAGCGTDPAPYFRIFNPIKQSEKFDPDGTYIRRYVPELADVPDEHLHEPWLRAGRGPAGLPGSRSWTTGRAQEGAGPLRRGQPMTRAERLAALLEQLVDAGRLDVDEAAERHEVSAATVRRDLDYLADQQLLSRTHGGAVPNTTSYDLPLRFKATSRGEAKQRIARRAVEMLWPGCTCALNGGTTTVEIARAIPGVQALHDGVTVVTNAVNIATELTVRPFIKIVVSGGVARPQTYELVGPIASETLGRLTPICAFSGPRGWT